MTRDSTPVLPAGLVVATPLFGVPAVPPATVTAPPVRFSEMQRAKLRGRRRGQVDPDATVLTEPDQIHLADRRD